MDTRRFQDRDDRSDDRRRQDPESFFDYDPDRESRFFSKQESFSRPQFDHEFTRNEGSNFDRGFSRNERYSSYGDDRPFYRETRSNRDWNREQRRDWERDRDMNRARDLQDESVWESVKSFFGMGPKGYRRSDERIREDVCEELARHHAIDARDIDVQVKDGTVTLTGTVQSRRMKRMAEESIDHVFGVSDVQNHLRISTNSTLASDSAVTNTSTPSSVKGTTKSSSLQ